MPTHGFDVSDVMDKKDLAVLEKGVAEHAKSLGAPPLVFTDMSILKKDEKGKILAGLYGRTFFDWLYVDTLWVSEALRGQGLGCALMQRAEQEAQNRGCVGVRLWTHSFDAPDFYRKQGYEQFWSMTDYPKGHRCMGFMKRIAT